MYLVGAFLQLETQGVLYTKLYYIGFKHYASSYEFTEFLFHLIFTL